MRRKVVVLLVAALTAALLVAAAGTASAKILPNDTACENVPPQAQDASFFAPNTSNPKGVCVAGPTAPL